MPDTFQEACQSQETAKNAGAESNPTPSWRDSPRMFGESSQLARTTAEEPLPVPWLDEGEAV
jgi:hypothetical protein